MSDTSSIIAGAADLLPRIAPLWQQLRQHHASLAPQWIGSLLNGAFAARQAELLGKSSGGMLVLLAINGTEDIGYCVSTIAADGTGEVDSLFVLDSHRGQGLGHTLMTRTFDWFASHNVQSLAVEVMGGNAAAQQFYARYGFVPRTVKLVRSI